MIHIVLSAAGNISDTHARAAREIDGVEIAAIYGTNREKSARMAQTYSAKLHDDLGAFPRPPANADRSDRSPSGLHAGRELPLRAAGCMFWSKKPIDIKYRTR